MAGAASVQGQHGLRRPLQQRRDFCSLVAAERGVVELDPVLAAPELDRRPARGRRAQHQERMFAELWHRCSSRNRQAPAQRRGSTSLTVTAPRSGTTTSTTAL